MLEIVKDHVGINSKLDYDVKMEGCGFRKDVKIKISNCGGMNFTGVLRIVLKTPACMESPWRMIPGFIYGENRRENERSRLYPRVDANCGVPREMCSSWWDFAADRVASPLVFAHQNGQAVALAASPHYTVSEGVVSDDPEPQVGIGFGGGYLRVSVPACEEPFTYTGTPECSPTRHRMVIPPGGSIELKVFIYEASGDRHCYQKIIEDYYRTIRGEHQPAGKPEMEGLLRDAVHGIMCHYHPEDNYFICSLPYFQVIEQICNARGTTAEWHQMNTGFVNGLPVCLALLKAGKYIDDPKAREAAVTVANRICMEGVSPSGLFRADFMPRFINTPNGRLKNPIFADSRPAEWGSGWLSDPELVHSRTIADACDSLAAMILLKREKDRESPFLPLWEATLRGNLDTVLDLQLPNGSYGQYYNAERRTVAKAEGCGGLLWIPALIKAMKIFKKDAAFTELAENSVVKAAKAYAPYVRNECIWGAPEDNESPTSEDGMNAVMAYHDLYEFTGDKEFLDLAVIAADWMLTFRKTYNVKIPAKSIMGQYGMKSMGGDFASASNNHLHVFEALCSRHLRRLSEWTGNDYYAARADEHLGFVCQHLSREDGMYDGFRGAMAEQFYWTNWGSFGSSWRSKNQIYRQKGSATLFTAIWCIAVVALAAEDEL